MKTIIIVIVIVSGIVGFIFFLNVNNSKNESLESANSTTNNKGSSLQIEKESVSSDSRTNSSEGRYVEYSKSVIEQTSDTQRVLFFYANWCPTCRPADQDFASNQNRLPSGTTVIRVNYNDSETSQEEKELANKYQVTYQHTFVQIDSKGNVITRWNGGKIDELIANIR